MKLLHYRTTGGYEGSLACLQFVKELSTDILLCECFTGLGSTWKHSSTLSKSRKVTIPLHSFNIWHSRLLRGNGHWGLIHHGSACLPNILFFVFFYCFCRTLEQDINQMWLPLTWKSDSETLVPTVGISSSKF
jgi:hypothetical protein